MRPLRTWFRRLAGLFNKQSRDRELARELGHHLEMHIADNVRAGLSPVEARRQALIKLGGLEQTMENYRDRRGLPALETLALDLRYALRILRHSPGFAAIAVLTLALGIGVNTGIFTILNAVALRPLPVPGAASLVSVYQNLRGHIHRNSNGSETFSSYAEYQNYRDHNQVFSGLLAYTPFVRATLGGVQPQEIFGTLSSCNYFEVLEVRPALGHGFTDADCSAPGANAVAVLSDDLWRSTFSANPTIIGQVVELNRSPFTVVGIASPGFQGTEPWPSAFWAPVTMQHELMRGMDMLGDEHTGWLVLTGRMKPGVSIAQARADLGVIAARIDALEPGRITALDIHTATLADMPEARTLVRGVGAILLCAVGLVLLVACANVANLLLARASGRRREMAVRLAMGASRARLLRQLLTESLLLALLGGFLGCIAAFWCSTALVQFLLAHLPPGSWAFTLNVEPDFRVLGYALALTLITGVAFGLVPALQASKADLTTALKEEGAGPAGRRGGGWRTALVGAQVAVSMILLLVAGLLLRGLYRAQTIDPGLNMNHVTVVSFDLVAAGYDEQRAQTLQRQLIERVAALPGVQVVAQATNAPLSDDHSGTNFSVPGRSGDYVIEYNEVSPDYFALLGIAIVRGRTFSDAEYRTGAPSMIVTAATARRLWPDRNALGQALRDGKGKEWQVIGVTQDAQVSHLAQSDASLVYLPAGPHEQRRMRLLVRGAGGYAGTAQGIRASLRALDPQLAVEVTRLEDNLEYWRAPSRIVSVLSAVLGGLALLLASIGVYGVVSYAVSRRIREIGIRMVLGANGGDVGALILRQAMRPVAVGAVIGIACCAAVSSVLSSLLYGVSPRDPLSFILVPAFLLAVAALASYLPARRAIRVDPMVALRYE